VVLLDSEGIDSAANEGFHDHQIFTLTVLLASVLIYNSQDVPSRHDREGLEYPFSKSDQQYLHILEDIQTHVFSCTNWSAKLIYITLFYEFAGRTNTNQVYFFSEVH